MEIQTSMVSFVVLGVLVMNLAPMAPSWAGGPPGCGQAAGLQGKQVPACPGAGGGLSIGIGDAVFWEGQDMGSFDASGLLAEGLLGVGGPPACELGATCYDYALELLETAPGARLRVAAQFFVTRPQDMRPLADAPTMVDSSYVLQLWPPGGGARTQAFGTGVYALEALVGGNDANGGPLPGPEVGTWTVRVLPEGSMDMSFRLRAKLEEPASDPVQLALPDLRIIPPFEVGFAAPTVTYGPGAPSDVAAPLATCMAEEVAEAAEEGWPAPLLCLRFSMGFANAGDGRLRLLPRPEGDAAGRVAAETGLVDVPLVQSVCDPLGKACVELARPDGLVARWHPSHLHFHYQNVYVFELMRVLDEPATVGDAPTLHHVGHARKLGAHPSNEALADWQRFFQQGRSWTGSPADNSGCLHGAAGICEIRLQAGWGDAYEWNRGGNYVDFPVDGTGLPVAGDYVLRGAADPAGHIVELNEGNNIGYAYFRVDGLGAVELMERGHGTDPWDPAKTVLDVAP